MDPRPSGVERREFARIKKHFVIRFVQKNNLTVKYEVSQVENISRGGMSFSSGITFTPDAELLIELRTPYMSETVHLVGVVLESKDKIPGILYQNRIKFKDLTPGAKDILDKIEKYNIKGA
ncbi:MAG: PilZ domain-containing protein [Candidatus Omnitrophica bacterium]|nr:PilZ domain-containing protein [Candidatus Omnitrophota bacterium]